MSENAIPFEFYEVNKQSAIVEKELFATCGAITICHRAIKSSWLTANPPLNKVGISNWQI